MPAASSATPTSSKSPLVLSIMIVTVGIGWLLSAMGIGQINWIWTLGLGVIGVLTFVLSGGVDKASVVIGPFFLIASVLSVLRQMDKLSLNFEMPVLVICVGLLLALAQTRLIPAPRWMVPLATHD